MSEEVTIIEKSDKNTLCISTIAPTMKLGKVMGPAYRAIMDTMAEQNVKCGDENIPYTKYKNIDWEEQNKTGFIAMFKMLFFHKWEMDIGIPCPESVTGSGSIKQKKLEGGKYLRSLHVGPYQKVGETYKKILSFAKSQNLDVKNFSIEFYLNDPKVVPAAQLETEVLVPVS